MTPLVDGTEMGAAGSPQAKNHDIYVVPGLERGLRVLEIVAAGDKPQTVSEIAQRMGLSRSSTFRLVYTLKFMGFLEPSADEHAYRLGPRVLKLGFAYLSGQSIIEQARRDLEALRDATNVSAHLAIREGRDVLFLDCVQTRTGFLSNVNVGTRLPAHAVPLGWFLLSDLTARELAALLGPDPLNRLTDQTPGDLPALMQRIARATSDGHVVSRGIAEPGGSSVSAPVFDRSGRVVAAIDISGPDSAFDPDAIESLYVPRVMHAAASISARLGAAPRGP